MWNISISEHCTLTSCALLKNCRFEASGALPRDPRIRLVKDHNPNVLCVELFRVSAFIKHSELFFLRKCAFVHPVIGNFAIHQMMTMDSTPLRCVGWFLYM